MGLITGDPCRKKVGEKIFVSKKVTHMLIAVSPEKIHLPPGAVIRFPGTWSDYQALVELRGECSIPRIKYRSREVLLMSPISPGHGRKANLVAYAIKSILEYLEQPFEAFTPITISLPRTAGFEPDYCFYIDNYEFAIGRECAERTLRERIDWETDPPPDLAIEVDVTSYTDLDDYLPYRVPEVWIIKKEAIEIYRYSDNKYNEVDYSRYFPGIDIKGAIAYCFSVAKAQPSSAVMQELRKMLNRNEFQS